MSVSKRRYQDGDLSVFDLQVSFVKEAIMKVLNLALLFADGWQAGLGAWQ